MCGDALAMKRLAIAIAVLAVSGCIAVNATATPDHDPGDGAERAAILDAVDHFLLAVGNHDTAALKELSVPEGTTFLQRITKDGAKPVVRRTNAELSGANGGDPFMERYWSP